MGWRLAKARWNALSIKTIAMSFNTKNIFKPTPKRMRRLGNALLGASQGVAIPAVYSDHKYIALAVLITGWAGKLITEFFADDDNNHDQQFSHNQ